MKVSELIKLLSAFHPDTAVVIELDDEYWHVADLDTACLKDPAAKNPSWDYDAHADGTVPLPNAVRICV